MTPTKAGANHISVDDIATNDKTLKWRYVKWHKIKARLTGRLNIII